MVAKCCEEYKTRFCFVLTPDSLMNSFQILLLKVEKFYIPIKKSLKIPKIGPVNFYPSFRYKMALIRAKRDNDMFPFGKKHIRQGNLCKLFLLFVFAQKMMGKQGSLFRKSCPNLPGCRQYD